MREACVHVLVRVPACALLTFARVHFIQTRTYTYRTHFYECPVTMHELNETKQNNDEKKTTHDTN